MRLVQDCATSSILQFKLMSSCIPVAGQWDDYTESPTAVCPRAPVREEERADAKLFASVQIKRHLFRHGAIAARVGSEPAVSGKQLRAKFSDPIHVGFE